MKIFAAAAVVAGLMTAGVANAGVVYFEGFDGYNTAGIAYDAHASGTSSVIDPGTGTANSFTTDYGFRSGATNKGPNSMYDEGTWTIGTNPNAVHDQWINLPESTNNMLMLNGKTLASDATAASTWTSNAFAVTAGNYQYSFDLMNLCCNTYTGVSSVLQFWFTDTHGVKNQIVGVEVNTPTTPGVFVLENGNFTVTEDGTVSVGLIDMQGAASGNDFGVDNITVATGSVPEPAAWALMLLGFGGMGSVLRSQRRRQAVAA
jgi:hypothetical protein